MAARDPQVDAFVAEAVRWREETAALRELMLEAGLDEAFKWRKPTYTRRGRNVAIIQGFKDFCAVLFLKGVLLDDPQGLLKSQGRNTQAALRLEFGSVAEVRAQAAAIRALLVEAIRVEDAGLVADFPAKRDLEYPDELVAAFDADPDLRDAFETLTPGRRRAYVMHFSEAKQSSTRAARIERHAPRILAGKGMTDR